MSNLAFCQLALKSEPAGSYFDKMAKRMRQAILLDAWSSGKRQNAGVQLEIILEDQGQPEIDPVAEEVNKDQEDIQPEIGDPTFREDEIPCCTSNQTISSSE